MIGGVCFCWYLSFHFLILIIFIFQLHLTYNVILVSDAQPSDWTLYNFLSDHPDEPRTHLPPHAVMIILLTVFPVLYSTSYDCSVSTNLFLFKTILVIFKDRGRKEGKEERNIDVWEEHPSVASRTSPNPWPGPKPRRVPWPGIKPATFQFAVWCSVQAGYQFVFLHPSTCFTHPPKPLPSGNYQNVLCILS